MCVHIDSWKTLHNPQTGKEMLLPLCSWPQRIYNPYNAMPSSCQLRGEGILDTGRAARAVIGGEKVAVDVANGVAGRCAVQQGSGSGTKSFPLWCRWQDNQLGFVSAHWEADANPPRSWSTGTLKSCHSTCGEHGGNDAALIVSAGHELVRLNIPMKEARLLPTRRSGFLELIRWSFWCWHSVILQPGGEKAGNLLWQSIRHTVLKRWVGFLTN